MFTGDCESEDEAAIINSTYALSSDVIKIAHHGSKHSTTSLFLGNVDPKYAVISVGGTNNYGHPTEDVLSKLKRRNIELYRTDIHGDIHCISDGKTITFDVQKNADVDPYITSGGYKNYLDEQAAKETEPPTERTTPVNTEPAPTEPRVTYIVNTNTGKFHYPSCSSVGQMKESNKWYYTGDRDDLIDLGYQPCGRCHP